MKQDLTKRFLSSALALSLCVSMLPTAFADDLDTNTDDVSGSTTQSIDTVLTAEALSFNITVPTSIPINVDAKGIVTVGDAFGITNNSIGPIEVTDFSVTSINDWSIVDYDTNFTKEKVDTQAYGIKFFDDEAPEDGDADGIVSIALASSEWTTIYGGDTLPITYNANVAAQSESISATNIGLVQITLDWSKIVNYSPIITGVTHGQVFNVAYGEDFVPPTVTATNYNGDALGITVVGLDEVDTSKAGTYEVTYSTEDTDNGTSKSVTISIVVGENMAPIITGVSDITVDYGASFDPMEGVEVTNYLGETSEAVSVSYEGSVDTSTEDTYSITYTVTDSVNGTSINAVRVVTVDDGITEISDFYEYSFSYYNTGYVVSLSDDFEAAVNSTETVTVEDNNGTTWTTGEALPSPVSEYEGVAVTSTASMFYNCTNITSLDLSKWDVSNIVDMWGMFRNCTSLVTLYAPWEACESLGSTENMFENCYKLSSLTINLYTNQDSFGSTTCMFSNCYSLTSNQIYVGINTTGVSFMYSGTNISKYTMAAIESWDFSNIMYACGLFMDAWLDYNIEYIDLTQWDISSTANLKNIFEYMFRGMQLSDLNQYPFVIYVASDEIKDAIDTYGDVPDGISVVVGSPN